MSLQLNQLADVTSIMSPVTVLLRFVFGIILAGGVVLWGGGSLLEVTIFGVAVGIVAAIWGDKFLMAFMSFMRYLR